MPKHNMSDFNNYDSDDSDGYGPISRCGGVDTAECIDLTLVDTDEEEEVQPSRLRRSKRKAATVFRSVASRSTAAAATAAIHSTVTQSASDGGSETSRFSESASDDSSVKSRFSEKEVRTKKKSEPRASKKRACKTPRAPSRNVQKRTIKQKKTKVKRAGKKTKVNSRKYGVKKQVSGLYYGEFEPLLVTKEIKQVFYLRWHCGNDKLKVREIGGKDECQKEIKDGNRYQLFCSKFVTREGQTYCRHQHEGESRIIQYYKYTDAKLSPLYFEYSNTVGNKYQRNYYLLESIDVQSYLSQIAG